MNVLIIEDDPKIASFLKKGLKEQDFVVELCHDGDKGDMNLPQRGRTM